MPHPDGALLPTNPQFMVRLPGPFTLRQLFQRVTALLQAPVGFAIYVLIEQSELHLWPERQETLRCELLGDHVYVELFIREGPGFYALLCT